MLLWWWFAETSCNIFRMQIIFETVRRRCWKVSVVGIAKTHLCQGMMYTSGTMNASTWLRLDNARTVSTWIRIFSIRRFHIVIISTSYIIIVEMLRRGQRQFIQNLRQPFTFSLLFYLWYGCHWYIVQIMVRYDGIMGQNRVVISGQRVVVILPLALMLKQLCHSHQDEILAPGYGAHCCSDSKVIFKKIRGRPAGSATKEKNQL